MSPVEPQSRPSDQVRASVSVRVSLVKAFDLFTSEIDQWWRRGPKFRHAGVRAGVIHIEPRVDGRVFESVDEEQGATAFEIGRVALWDPPHRFMFSWRNANFAPSEVTEVDVQFREGNGSTIVEVTHRGWAALRADHPARHGLENAAFARMMGLWWGQLLSSFREHSRDPSDHTVRRVDL